MNLQKSPLILIIKIYQNPKRRFLYKSENVKEMMLINSSRNLWYLPMKKLPNGVIIIKSHFSLVFTVFLETNKQKSYNEYYKNLQSKKKNELLSLLISGNFSKAYLILSIFRSATLVLLSNFILISHHRFEDTLISNFIGLSKRKSVILSRKKELYTIIISWKESQKNVANKNDLLKILNVL